MPGHEEGSMLGLLEASSTIQEHSARARWQRRAKFTLLGAGLVILAMELGLRLFGSPPMEQAARQHELHAALAAADGFQSLPEASGRYGLRPGASLQVAGVEYSISNQGTRGADFERSKPAGQKRLLVLGAELALGVGQDLQASLAWKLASLANADPAAPGKDSWLGINLGVPGYHSKQQFNDLAARGMGFEPDLVLAYADAAQVQGSEYFLDWTGGLQRDRLPLPYSWRNQLWKSRLYAWISSRYLASQEPKPAQRTPQSDAWARGRTLDEVAAGYDQMRELCQAAGVAFRLIDGGQDATLVLDTLRSEGLLP
jgi:hypothetical protein